MPSESLDISENFKYQTSENRAFYASSKLLKSSKVFETLVLNDLGYLQKLECSSKL
jgi:hypothetical protein